MTEEQKKKCKEIYDLYIHNIEDSKGIIEYVISLAKVFNKDITEEEAKEIHYNIFKEACASNVVMNLYMPYITTFWGIANYFDDGTSGMKPNYIINKAFEERNKNK